MPVGVEAGASLLLVTYGDPSIHLHRLPTVSHQTCHLQEAGELEAVVAAAAEEDHQIHQEDHQIHQEDHQIHQEDHQIHQVGTHRGFPRPKPISMRPW